MKPSVYWQKVTDVLPENGQECLVWTGHYMYVSTAEFYSEEVIAQWPEAQREEIMKTKGRFKEFGEKSYFDDPKVYWSPIPLAPGEQNPTPPDLCQGMVNKDVYLTRDGDIVGIHAIGDEHEGKFYQMEIWGNVYNEDHEMQGRGSFRVFDELENEVKNWEADGWVRREAPKKKDKV